MSKWYFMTTYVYVRNPQMGGIVKFEPWEHQRQLLQLWEVYTRLVVLKARQLGVSWAVVGDALWESMFRPGSNILFFSRRQTEAIELKDRAKFIWRHLPDFLRLPIGKDNDEILTFPAMDSKIQSFPATEGAGRGETASKVVLDEWADMPYARQLYTAVLPTVERGRLMGISTAKGRNNLFYEIYTGAKAGTNNFKPVFIPYNALPHRNMDTWKAQAADMPAYMAFQEYPWREEEAFLVGGTCMFDVDKLKSMPVQKPVSFIGPAEVFVPPADHEYSAGIDTALGIAGRDASVCQVIDDNTGQVVAKLSSRMPLESFAEAAFELLKQYHFPLVAVEEQPQGLLIYKVFKDNRYPMHRIFHRSRNVPLWYTTAKNRQNVLAELEQAIRTDSIVIYSDETIGELLGFGYNEEKQKFEALSGHDDEVMALALANHMRLSKTKVPRDFFKPKSYLKAEYEGGFVDIRSINWSKPNPYEGLIVFICPMCEGERVVVSQYSGTTEACPQCLGLGEVLKRVS